MFGLGAWELAIIVAVVAIIFGAGRLPAVGESLGRAVKELRTGAGSSGRPESSKEARAESEEEKDPVQTLAAEVLPKVRGYGRLKATSGKLRLLSRIAKFIL